MTDQLDLRKTYRAILDAARDRRFISYGDLAKANLLIHESPLTDI